MIRTPPTTASVPAWVASVWPIRLAVAPSETKTVEKPSTKAIAARNTRRCPPAGASARATSSSDTPPM
jgi:hypothetical protein